MEEKSLSEMLQMELGLLRAAKQPLSVHAFKLAATLAYECLETGHDDCAYDVLRWLKEHYAEFGESEELQKHGDFALAMADQAVQAYDEAHPDKEWKH